MVSVEIATCDPGSPIRDVVVKIRGLEPKPTIPQANQHRDAAASGVDDRHVSDRVAIEVGDHQVLGKALGVVAEIPAGSK